MRRLFRSETLRRDQNCLMGSELTGDYRSGASAEAKRPPTVRNKSAIKGRPQVC